MLPLSDLESLYEIQVRSEREGDGGGGRGKREGGGGGKGGGGRGGDGRGEEERRIRENKGQEGREGSGSFIASVFLIESLAYVGDESKAREGEGARRAGEDEMEACCLYYYFI